MRRSVRLATTALAVLAVLAGCGQGGSDPEPTASASSPAPLPTEEAAIEGALPTLDQVPGASDVDFQCPKDEEKCAGSDVGHPFWAFSVRLDSVGNPVDIERNGTTSAPNDVAVVNLNLLDDAEAARTFMAGLRKDQKPYDGTFDIPAKPVGGGREVPASSGEGSLDDVTVQGLDGYLSSYRLDSAETGDPAQRVVSLLVGEGRVVVGVFVSMSAPGRDADAAEQLAQRLARDTVERLRKGAATFTQ
ncbi:hypothetical protein ASF35_05000 [Aeromicrobium sp. Leaf291]|nr:hypothetical protein ASF35_05000 [Aeromicrobium sp. Leaf291]